MKNHFFLLLLFTSRAFSHSTDADLQQIPDGNLKPVQAGLMILDIHKIDNIEESIRGEFILFMRWEDSTLCEAGQREII